MRHTMLVSLAVLAGLSTPVWADGPLTGWGKLDFGMSPDQVRAVKGMAWNDLVKFPVPGGLSTMDTKKTLLAFGLKAVVRLTFDGASSSSPSTWSATSHWRRPPAMR